MVALILLVGALQSSSPSARQNTRGSADSLVIRVTDVRHVGLADVEIVVRDRLGRSIGQGRTDTRGEFRPSPDARSHGTEVVARKIGFVPTRRLVPGAENPTRVEIALAALPAVLAPVAIGMTAIPRNVRERWPIVDSAEIAKVPNLSSVLEVIEKLRPRIGFQHYRCPVPAYRFYVNGVRLNYAAATVRDILRQTRAADVAELRYVNCLDRAIASTDVPGAARFYITLKDAAEFSAKSGSSEAAGYHPPDVTLTDSAVAGSGHRRLLTIRDSATGAPIDGADVTSVFENRLGFAGSNGMLSAYLPMTGAVALRVRKRGYVSKTIGVSNLAADTSGILVSLTFRGPTRESIGSMTTDVAGAPADSSLKLVLVGFYERRSARRGSTAFFGTSEIGAATSLTSRLVSSPAWISSAQDCAVRLYVDGAASAFAGRSEFPSEGLARLETIVSAEMVSAIEFLDGDATDWTTGTDSTATPVAPTSRRCALLVWTG